MDKHDIAILMFYMLGIVIMFLPNVFGARGTTSSKSKPNSQKPEKWQRVLSCLAFLQACMFVAVGFACEAAGAHWLVGAFCVLASLSCSVIVLWLNGLRLEHFIPRDLDHSQTSKDRTA